MPRLRPPSAGADPANDLARDWLSRSHVATPRDLRRVIEEDRRGSVSTPRVRPVVSGSRSSGEALANLLRILEERGDVEDKTEA